MKTITIDVSVEMYSIVAKALLDNLLAAEKVCDHTQSSEFATDNAANAALMFHEFVSAFC
jgi:hypothetical protein